jgi:cyclase
MASVRVIPCLDIRDGRVVKGVKFQNLQDMGDPALQARNYALQGADEIVVLDVTATLETRLASLQAITAIRQAINIPLTVGGGLDGLSQARRLLQAGADKVAVNSAAVRRPELLGELAREFGRQCVVLAIDGCRDEQGNWRVGTRSGSQWENLDVVSWARRGAELGAGEILLTSWDRDGTAEGYDLELIAAVRDAVNVPVIASGGGAEPQHMVDAVKAGADAVLAAGIFHSGRWQIQDLKQELAGLGMEVRP